MIVERVPYYGWPQPTPTNPERIEAWRQKYARGLIERQVEPFRRSEAPTRQGVPPAPPPHCRAVSLFFDQTTSESPGAPGKGTLK